MSDHEPSTIEIYILSKQGLLIAVGKIKQLESDLATERERVRVLTEFARDIANEIYPYPDQAVRKADEALAKVRE